MLTNRIQPQSQNGEAWMEPAPYGKLRYVLLFFLFLDYVRPPVLGELKLQLVIVLLMLFMLVRAKDRPWSGILLAHLLMFALIAKSVPIAANNFLALQATRAMLGYLTIAFTLAWLMSWIGSFRQIAWFWVIVTAYAAAYGLLHGGKGPGNFLGDENDLAIACIVALPFALFAFDYLDGGRRWGALLIAMLLIVGIVATQSRGGFLGLATVWLYYMLSDRSRLFHKCGIVAVAIIAFFLFAPQKYLDEIYSIKTDVENRQVDERGTTAQKRLFHWAIGMRMWAANPILGVGADNYPVHSGTYQPRSGKWPSSFFDREWTWRSSHSLYLQVITELGLLGIIVFGYLLWIHFSTLRQLRHSAVERKNLPPDLRRDVDIYARALIGGMLGFLVSGAFISVLYYPHVWYLSAMAVGFHFAFRRATERAGHDHEAKKEVEHETRTNVYDLLNLR